MTQQHIEGRTKMEVDDTLKELGQYFGGTFVDSFENTNNNKGGRLVTRRRRQSQRVKDQECQADEEGEESEGAKIKPKFIHKKKVLLQDPKTVKNGDSSQPFWRPFQGQNPAQDQAQMKMTAKGRRTSVIFGTEWLILIVNYVSALRQGELD